MSNNISLLYVEDNDKAREHYASAFAVLFEKVYQAENATKAYELYQRHKPDILLVDINLPDGDGLELIETLRVDGCRSLVIILSAYSQREQLFKAIELNLYKYLVKPIKNDELLAVIKGAIQEIEVAQGKVERTKISKNLSWNQQGNCLYYNDEIILLSSRENKLIELLMSNTKRIFTLDEIAYFISDNNKISSDQAIKNIIHRLRNKVPTEFISNIYGVGYQINIS